MPEQVDLYLKVLKEVSSTFGPILGLFLIALAICMWIILFYFQRRIEGIANEITEKSVSSFNARLQVAFRDEYLRNNLRFELAKKSVQEQLALYEAVYRLYFEYQECWSWTRETPFATIQILWQKVLATRQRLFFTAVFIGPELFGALFKATATMLTNLQTLRRTQEGVQTDTKREMEITASLDNAGKILSQKLFTYQDVAMYEFSDEQIQNLATERNRVIAQEPPQ